MSYKSKVKLMPLFLSAAGVLLVGGVIFYFSSPLDKAELGISLQHKDRAVVDVGKAIYAENCASCHGDNLQGQPNWSTKKDKDGHNLSPPLNGTGHTWHHSQEQLFSIIRYGFKIYNENYDGKMQGNDKLNDTKPKQREVVIS